MTPKTENMHIFIAELGDSVVIEYIYCECVKAYFILAEMKCNGCFSDASGFINFRLEYIRREEDFLGISQMQSKIVAD